MASEDSPFDVAPTDGNDDPLAGGMADVAISDDAGASPFEQAGAERKGTVDFEASHSSVDDGMTSYNDLLAPPSYEDSVAFEAPPAAEETAKEVMDVPVKDSAGLPVVKEKAQEVSALIMPS